MIVYGQAFGYMLPTIKMINNYQTKAKQTLSSYNPDTFRWLWSLMFLMILMWSLKGIFGLIYIVPIANMLADFLLVVLIYVIAIVHWRNPSLFHIQQLKGQLVSPAAQISKQSSNGVLDQELHSSVFEIGGRSSERANFISQ